MKFDDGIAICEEMYRFYISDVCRDVVHQSFEGYLTSLYKSDKKELFSTNKIRKTISNVRPLNGTRFSRIVFRTKERPYKEIFAYVLRTKLVGCICSVSIIRHEFKLPEMKLYESTIDFMDDKVEDFFMMFSRKYASEHVCTSDFTNYDVTDIIYFNIYEQYDFNYKFESVRDKYSLDIHGVNEDHKKFVDRIEVTDKKTREVVFWIEYDYTNQPVKMGKFTKLPENADPDLVLLVKHIYYEIKRAESWSEPVDPSNKPPIPDIVDVAIDKIFKNKK